MTDIASAARRVADDTRQGNRPLPDDMLAILPVLDAVAAGRDDAGRVERWARAIAVAVGKLENRWEWFVAEARAAIALADAERAAESGNLFDDLVETLKIVEGPISEDDGHMALDALEDVSDRLRGILDKVDPLAAVRRLAGLSEPA